MLKLMRQMTVASLLLVPTVGLGAESLYEGALLFLPKKMPVAAAEKKSQYEQAVTQWRDSEKKLLTAAGQLQFESTLVDWEKFEKVHKDYERELDELELAEIAVLQELE